MERARRVSEGLSSVETLTLIFQALQYLKVSEGLSSVETFPQYTARCSHSQVSEGLSSVETAHRDAEHYLSHFRFRRT